MAYETNTIFSPIKDVAVELLDGLADAILESAEVIQVRRYGRHIATTYRDGRVTVLTSRRWPGEPDCGPTPYEMLQLGLPMPRLCPTPPWVAMPELAAYGWISGRTG